MRRIAGIGACRTILHTSSVPHWQVALVISFACSNLRWGVGTLPPQFGVYVPRRLGLVDGPVTSASDPESATSGSLFRLAGALPTASPCLILDSRGGSPS
jgi:hypothetical protein